jgi:hypothetical protein
VSSVRYVLGFYIPEDGILHSHRRENLKPYISLGILGSRDCLQRFSSRAVLGATFSSIALNTLQHNECWRRGVFLFVRGCKSECTRVVLLPLFFIILSCSVYRILEISGK